MHNQAKGHRVRFVAGEVPNLLCLPTDAPRCGHQGVHADQSTLVREQSLEYMCTGTLGKRHETWKVRCLTSLHPEEETERREATSALCRVSAWPIPVQGGAVSASYSKAPHEAWTRNLERNATSPNRREGLPLARASASLQAGSASQGKAPPDGVCADPHDFAGAEKLGEDTMAIAKQVCKMRVR